MKIDMRMRALRAGVIACILTTAFILWHLHKYDHVRIFESIAHYREKVILFPSSFDEDIDQYIAQHFDELQVKGMTAIRAKPRSDLSFQNTKSYHEHPVTVYSTAKNIAGKLFMCGEELRKKLLFRISGLQLFQQDIKPMLDTILHQVESGNNEYLRSISSFFIDNLKQDLETGVYGTKWYKFSGSSVFLKEYGLHYMISRVVYSPLDRRDDPRLSLVYAQLFDTNWNEVKSSLVVPTNNVNNEHEVGGSKSKEFRIISFPQIVEIPFMQEIESTDGKYFGAEDAHVSLVKNEAGHEEPMLVYNLLHKNFFRNPKAGEPGEEEFLFQNTRSMFMAFPFQQQKGKVNVDGDTHPQYDEKLYIKSAELIIKGQPRAKKQKNWVPMIDMQERERYGYDKNIYIVFSWHDFAVLKCDLRGFCGNDFEMPHVLAGIGALRGGTQMVNINDLLLTAGGDHALSKIPRGRQIWAGFPRAHIDQCGCGSLMYRPNLAIIIKDIAPSGEPLYKVSHVSSSIGFDVPVLGWDLNRPLEVCDGGPNVLLSNGISLWNVESLTEHGVRWRSKDYMTLMLSMGDYTIHAVHIEGLLDLIINLDGPALFNNQRKLVFLPDLLDAEQLIGYNSENIDCAIEQLKEFCSFYPASFEEFRERQKQGLEKFMSELRIPHKKEE